MKLFKPNVAEIGSPRWWRRALTDVGLRVVALVWLVTSLATKAMSGGYFWFGVAFAVIMGLLLVLPVGACATVLLGKHERTGEPTD